MTEAESLVAQLRDIHLPADSPASPPAGFATWPIVVFVVVLAGVLAIRYWYQHAWRRRARAELREIDKNQELAARWTGLLRLAEGVARMRRSNASLPQAAYRHPGKVTDKDAAELSAYLYAQTRR